MPVRTNPQALRDAVGWAIWCLDRTDMTAKTVFRKARLRFGVPAAQIERICRERLGETYFWERSERLLERYRPEYSAKQSRTARILQPLRRHWREI